RAPRSTARYGGLPLPAETEGGDDAGSRLRGASRGSSGMTRTADKPQVLLEHHLRVLKLPTFLAEYEKVARESAADGIDHPRYLLRLAELELIERERRLVD